MSALFAGAANAFGAIPSDDLLRSLRPTADLYVNDYAHVLSDADRLALDERCKQLRQRTGAQLAVVILPSLQGGQIEDFAQKLFKRWGLGDKEQKNGVMLLVSIEDHHARIEVGYGLEPILPDALAGRLLVDHLVPEFRQQHYAAGIQATVNQICQIIERGEPAAQAGAQGPVLNPANRVFVTGFLTIFVAVGAFILGVGLGNKLVPVSLFALFFAGVPILMGGIMAAPLAPLIHIPVACLLCWLGWRTGRNQRWPVGRSSGSPGWGGSAWSWGDFGSSGGWSSGGSFSGGGFSSDGGGFGGGSSGGGGASVSW